MFQSLVYSPFVHFSQAVSLPYGSDFQGKILPLDALIFVQWLPCLIRENFDMHMLLET